MTNILTSLRRLKIDRARGPAPHKPLLLLCLLELAEAGGLTEEVFPVTGELTFRFVTYWSVVAHRRKQGPDIKLPLIHMESGFWQALDKEGQTLKHRALPAFLKLQKEFVACMNDAESRLQARIILITTYFSPDEQAGLWALTGVAEPTEERKTDVLACNEEARGRGREGRFRIDVVNAYNYTCALTGYRLITVSSGTIVDAAHIHQFADSRNNVINNGLSLSKNAHWLFDCGLWSLEDDYRVVVAERHFSEAGTDAYLLSAMKGKKILLPRDRENWPAAKHLRWHREHKFLGD